MTDFYEILRTDNPAASADWMSGKSDEELAYWLAVDAGEREPWPGNNNHLAATREAARRLYERQTGREREWIEFGKKMYEHGIELSEAMAKILYVKDEK